jgi:hypothetical protein
MFSSSSSSPSSYNIQAAAAAEVDGEVSVDDAR